MPPSSTTVLKTRRSLKSIFLARRLHYEELFFFQDALSIDPSTVRVPDSCGRVKSRRSMMRLTLHDLLTCIQTRERIAGRVSCALSRGVVGHRVARDVCPDVSF